MIANLDPRAHRGHGATAGVRRATARRRVGVDLKRVSRSLVAIVELTRPWCKEVVMRSAIGAALLLVSWCGPVLADFKELQQFLRSVEAATQVRVPLRGDGVFEMTSPDGSRRDNVVVILRPAADTYIELQRARSKTLLLGTTGERYRCKASASPEALKPEAPFEDSDFTVADLQPFRMSDYGDPLISDETASELTVTLFPHNSQYSLIVITFDRGKRVPLKTLYYRERLNNLVKMRRDSGHVLVGRKWMPATISVETFRLRTRTSLRFRWQQHTSVAPELFDPTFLSRPSAVVWPTAAVVPGPGESS